MSDSDHFFQKPHRRLNLLTGQWIQVSPHRTQRPWQGKQEQTAGGAKLQYDPSCYLCPGNSRSGGKAQNPAYTSTFVFDNDFSALLPDVEDASLNQDGLLVGKTERGLCKVICFSPRHNLTLPEMTQQEVRAVVDVWTQQYAELGAMPGINYVQIFENKGDIMGCSNPHPHGQIWAQESIPEEPAKELVQQEIYFKKHGRTLLSDYLKLEIEKGERIVTQNDHFVVLVPFWAFWPYETLVVSRRSFGRFTDMTGAEKDGLADIIRRITIRYDNLFQVSFPYSAGFHPSPTDGKDHPEWHFHMHFYPPLLRSATVKKFSVGYEMLGNAQRDITAEYAAEVLRGLAEVHYMAG
jgi:UDPglucose--hexose-1-phosphate uridylyltransferase